MRILSISGQNIASLAAPFCIDFTAAPLLGAGLFAITGETGAGKSSILDAMCLALYGDAPRLAAGSSGDEVPDAVDPIKAKDPRTMLRRGAVQGWAEVRFTAIDGQDYIAHWQARRARDKADGKLQGVARKLARVADGQILASQTNAVTEQITALTGLSYEEFRRTVLLAQGDFDAFLRADTNDRAALLEKVTGTGLYRAVSAKIYDRTETARQAHAALAVQRDAHRLLSPEDRAAMETERLALIAAQGVAAAERATLTAGLERHRRQARAADQLAEAEALEHTAVAAAKAADPDRAQLAMIDTAEPLRLPWQAVLNSVERAKATGIALQDATIARDHTSQEAEHLRGLADHARSAAMTKEDEFKAFGPLWDQAADLDSQLQSATSEAETAATHARDQAQAAIDAQTALGLLQADDKAAKAAQADADCTLTALRAALPLADHWDQTQRDIAEHAKVLRAQSDANTLADSVGERLATLSLRAEALSIAAQTDQIRERELTEGAADLATQIGAMEADHPPAKSGMLAALSKALTDMARARSDHHAARAEHDTATRTGANARDGITKATAAIDAATDAMTRADAQITALTAPLAQADLALSDIAKNLRLQLEDGVPCPVCGSCAHTVHADAALAQLAETLRGDIAVARHHAAAARADNTLAQGQFAAAQAQAAQAATTAATAALRIESTVAAWKTARDLAVAVPLCPELPAQPGADSAALDRVLTDTATQQQAEQTALSTLTDLRKTLRDSTETRETLRTAIAARGNERETLTKELALGQQQLALAQQDINTQSARKTTLEATLRPLLLAAGEAPDALGLDPQLGQRLAALVDQITTARATAKTATEALSTLAPKIATAAANAKTAADQAASATATLTTRQDKCATLQSQRAPLLGGEATAAHRSRFNDSRKQALEALTQTGNAHATAAQLAAAALARHEACMGNDATATAAQTAANSILEAALMRAQLSAETLARLFALPRDQIEGLRRTLRALDDAVTGARTARAARHADLTTIAAETLPEETQEALTAALEALETNANQRGERIGAIHGDIARDDLTRKDLIGLEAAIALAKAEHEVWLAVNNAAGSRSGDKFARVAQSITLDVMVDHANHHLADLNPRYRLRRAADLALQVEDRDMGDEARATRSLSGGERFLVSLALALALSRMGGKGGLAATLFIDEGFGSLDPTSLDLAIDALESLQSQGRQVGVISHVEAMKDRIPIRIAVRKQGGGKSVVEVTGLDPIIGAGN